MLTMWFAADRGSMPWKVEVADCKEAARVVWDALVARGFHAVSTRP